MRFTESRILVWVQYNDELRIENGRITITIVMEKACDCSSNPTICVPLDGVQNKPDT